MAVGGKMRHAKLRIFVWVAIALLVACGGFCYFYFFDTTQSAFAPQCFFLKLTGWRCPGCGTQRAFHELAHLNVAGVARYNPFLFFAIPYLFAIVYAEIARRMGRSPRFVRFLYSRPAIMAVFWLIVAYWILRNVFNI